MKTTPIDSLLDTIEWQLVEPQERTPTDGLPYATHSGVLEIMDVRLRCYRLNTGQVVFDADDMEAWLATSFGENHG